MWIMGRPRPSSTAGPGEKAWFNAQPHFAEPHFAGDSRRPTNETAAWQAGQHNANIVRRADGTLDGILMFDNGAKTGGKADQGTPSRVVRFDIMSRPNATSNGVAVLEFESYNYGWEGFGRSPFLGGARLLPNGNYLGQVRAECFVLLVLLAPLPPSSPPRSFSYMYTLLHKLCDALPFRLIRLSLAP
jgi:hypothetical protein